MLYEPHIHYAALHEAVKDTHQQIVAYAQGCKVIGAWLYKVENLLLMTTYKVVAEQVTDGTTCCPQLSDGR